MTKEEVLREKREWLGFMDGFYPGIRFGKQEALVSLLRAKFPKVPEEVLEKVRREDSEKTLEAWGKEILRARRWTSLSFARVP